MPVVLCAFDYNAHGTNCNKHGLVTQKVISPVFDASPENAVAPSPTEIAETVGNGGCCVVVSPKFRMSCTSTHKKERRRENFGPLSGERAFGMNMGIFGYQSLFSERIENR